MFKRILFICIGNICRSPTAEYLLRARLASDGIDIGSAGLGALVGKPMDAMASQVLLEHGVDGSTHRGRQVTRDLLLQSDLILVMEKSHIAVIGRSAPEVSGKVFLLGKWQADKEIPDPYGQSRPSFDHVYQLIDRGISGWLPYLNISEIQSRA